MQFMYDLLLWCFVAKLSLNPVELETEKKQWETSKEKNKQAGAELGYS